MRKQRWAACVLAALLCGCGQGGGFDGGVLGSQAPSASDAAASVSETGPSASDAGASEHGAGPPVSGAAEGQTPPDAGEEGAPAPEGEESEILRAVFLSGVAADNWQSGAQIDPDLLCDFYMIDTLASVFPDGWERDDLAVPVEKVASKLSETFEGVTADHLRGAKLHYVAETDRLRMASGIGGGSTYEVTGWLERDGLTVVEFDVLAGGIPGNVVRHVALTADLTVTPRKFLTCEVTELEPAENPDV